MYPIKRIALPVSMIIMLAIFNMSVFAQQSPVAVLDTPTQQTSTMPLRANVLSQTIPALIAPADGFTTTNPDIAFSWGNAGSAGIYQIQVSNSSAFSGQMALDIIVSATSHTYKLYSAGTFYWRVRTRGGYAPDSSYGAWSSVRQFIIQPMSAPELLAPTNTLTTSDPNVTLSWGAVTDAPQYQIQIAHIYGFYGDNILHDTTVTPTSYNYVFSMVGTYYWRVRAKNGTVEGEWSSVRRFTIESSSVPTLIAPREMAISYTPTFMLIWSAVSGATGYDIQVATDFNFTTIVAEKTTSDTSIAQVFFLYDRYYWRVRAVGELWSQPRTVIFTFTPFSGGSTTYLNVNNDFSTIFFRDNAQSLFINGINEYDFLTGTTRDLWIAQSISALGSASIGFVPHISSDGRYALVQMTFNGVQGVYRYDRTLNTVTLISKQSNGTPMNPVNGVDISDDGNLSLFIFAGDYYLHNFQTSQTVRVSTFTSPTFGTLMGYISPNNRYVAIVYQQLGAGELGGQFLYLYDVQAQTSYPIMTPNNTPVTVPYFWGSTMSVAFYDNDRYIVFNSAHSALVPDPRYAALFAYDIQTGLYETIPLRTPDGSSVSGLFQDLSPDGRYVVFNAHDYDDLGNYLGYQMYVYDRQQNTVTHVSKDSNGVPAQLSFYPYGRISYDGSFVAFNGTLEHYGVSQQGMYIYTFPPHSSIEASGQSVFSPFRLSGVGSSSLTTEFRWTPVRGAQNYRIQISTNAEFSTILYDATVTTTSHTQTFAQKGTYYWRVRGQKSFGGGVWSDTFQFILGEGATISLNEQPLFGMAQPHLSHDITSILFDITPAGILTTAQFSDGGVVTTTARLSLVNGFVKVNLESVMGGNATQQAVLYEVIPTLLMAVLEENLPDNYLVIESIGLTHSDIIVNLVMPSNG